MENRKTEKRIARAVLRMIDAAKELAAIEQAERKPRKPKLAGKTPSKSLLGGAK